MPVGDGTLGSEVVVMSRHVVTVTATLDGHTALDIQCPDRIYLNCYERPWRIRRVHSGASIGPGPRSNSYRTCSRRTSPSASTVAERRNLSHVELLDDPVNAATRARPTCPRAMPPYCRPPSSMGFCKCAEASALRQTQHRRPPDRWTACPKS
jgi:hypothetical protein